MKTKIFEHKGIVGITCDTSKGGSFLNNQIEVMMEIGVIVESSSVEISPKALEILKGYPKSENEIGNIDIFKDKKGTIGFGWVGGLAQVLFPDAVLGKKSDPTLFDTFVVVENLEYPEGFVEATDEFLSENPQHYLSNHLEEKEN